jgi:hypothetical protein
MHFFTDSYKEWKEKVPGHKVAQTQAQRQRVHTTVMDKWTSQTNMCFASRTSMRYYYATVLFHSPFSKFCFTIAFFIVPCFPFRRKKTLNDSSVSNDAIPWIKLWEHNVTTHGKAVVAHLKVLSRNSHTLEIHKETETGISRRDSYRETICYMESVNLDTNVVMYVCKFCVYVCVCMYVYVCMCVCMYVSNVCMHEWMNERL